MSVSNQGAETNRAICLGGGQLPKLKESPRLKTESKKNKTQTLTSLREAFGKRALPRFTTFLAAVGKGTVAVGELIARAQSESGSPPLSPASDFARQKTGKTDHCDRHNCGSVAEPPNLDRLTTWGCGDGRKCQKRLCLFFSPPGCWNFERTLNELS